MVVKAENIVKKYKELTALDHFNMEVKEGEILGLLGPNGCGKTTAINCILSLLKFDKGDIQVFGQKMTPNSYNIKRQIGLVPQEVAVFENLTVKENIDYFCGLYIDDKNIRKEYVNEAIDFVGLTEYKKFYPKKLSGGLKRRLNIACGISHKPKLIFLDEPTVAVDAQSRNFILEGIKRLNEEGSTIIYTTHYLEEAEMLCDRIIIMDRGKSLVTGTVEELKSITSTREKIIDRSGLNQTVIKGILDQITQIIALNEPMQNLDFGVNYLSAKTQETNSMLVIFYSLIAMVSTYGIFPGIETAVTSQANLTDIGARINTTPIKKSTLLISGVTDGLLINISSNILLLLFLRFILKMDLFTNIWYSAIFIFLGNLFGISLGIFVGSSNKKSPGVKIMFSNATHKDGKFDLARVKDVLKEKVKVDVLKTGSTSKNSGIDTWFGTYFNFIGYIVITIYILVIGLIMAEFNDKNIRDRMRISSKKFLKSNAEIYLGQITLGMSITTVFILGGIMLRGGDIGGIDSFRYIINAYVFSFAILCFTFLINNLTTSRFVISGVSTVVSLGTAFISGVFVPQELLGEKVLSMAKFFPVYYYVRLNNMRAVSAIDMSYGLRMQLLFGAVFLLAGLCFSRAKQKI